MDDTLFVFKLGYFRSKYDLKKKLFGVIHSASSLRCLWAGGVCVLPAEVLVPQAAVLRRSGPDQHASQERQNPKNQLQGPAVIRFLPK